MNNNKLYRDELNKKIGGVCAGLAEYFNVDVALVRTVFVLALILKGGGLLIYIVLWIVLPKKPYLSPDETFFSATQPGFAPSFAPAPKTVGTGSIIGGAILIVLGAYLMLDQFDIIPPFQFSIVGPVVLITIGLVFIFGFWKKHPEQQSTTWVKDETTATDNQSSTENSQTL